MYRLHPREGMQLDSLPPSLPPPPPPPLPGQVISCRAAVAWEAGQPMTIETIEVQPPKKGEVRVKVRTPRDSWSGNGTPMLRANDSVCSCGLP